ncbi:MAG: penicillin acylase family protein [Enterobacterales bacterium]|nr:penicillin acylase family protein [Enterobacterales bacterium]
MIKKILLILAAILVFGTIWGYFHIESKNPIRNGQLELKGLKQAVTVNFDHYGVPHIKAKTDDDLYLALGYIHAQDRLFQMEISRRLAQGKMAEILGEELVGVDKLFRTLGLESYSKKLLTEVKKRSDPKMISLMQRYLDGINLFVEQGEKPIEFELIGIPQHQYTMVDIASVTGLTSFSFAQGLRDDPLVSYLAQKLGQDYMADLGILHTTGSQQIPVDAMDAKALSSQVSQLVSGLQSAGLFHGSNSWLIAPSKSSSGQAMLVNDPHIAFSQPSVWYEAQLQSDTTDIYGHFLGLVPLPMLGMSKTHAWGLTMFENDDMDIYLEKINPQNPDQYWAIDHWQDFEKRSEEILVKGQEAINFEVLSTRHGPIVNQIFSGIKDKHFAPEKFEKPLALWWAFLNTDNQMMEAFYALPKADTLDKARQAAAMIHAPGLNLMYANSQGDIAWWAAAKLPIRPDHVNPKYILDGASGKDDILGYYDFSHNPQQVNPESGFLYSANNQPQDMGDGLVPGYYYAERSSATHRSIA